MCAKCCRLIHGFVAARIALQIFTTQALTSPRASLLPCISPLNSIIFKVYAPRKGVRDGQLLQLLPGKCPEKNNTVIKA